MCYCERLLAEALEDRESRKYKEYMGETERAECKSYIQNDIITLLHTTMLSSTIYTSPHGTDRSTVYFNAHTSI